MTGAKDATSEEDEAERFLGPELHAGLVRVNSEHHGPLRVRLDFHPDCKKR
jgi:hypothetical protein